MADFTLVIANKRYSSWSLRAYLAMALTRAEFDEVLIPLGKADTDARIREYNPAGLVPVLRHGDFLVWDTLAIGEYLNELFPQAGLLPADIKSRARARSMCAEMHSGFGNLRQHLTMNIGRRYNSFNIPQAAAADINRICDIWRSQLAEHGGRFLFGDRPGLADCFFAPVVTRFMTYNVAVDRVCRSYMDNMMTFPAMGQWIDAALKETDIIAKYEYEASAAA
jgi:glutathione S-transferase